MDTVDKLIILIGATVVSLGATVISASAQSKYLDAPEGGGAGRPADFYAVVAEADPVVCRPILRSLNKEYRIDDSHLDTYPRISVQTDSLLGSDLEVAWSRRLVQEPDAQSYKLQSLDLAQVKFGSQVVSLYRRTIEKFSVENGALSINRLWLSRAPLISLPDDRPLTETDVGRFPGTEISIDVPERLKVGEHIGPLSPAAQPALLNVVSINGGLYLLAVDPVQAELTAPRSVSGAIDLYVVRLSLRKDFRVVCHLRST